MPLSILILVANWLMKMLHFLIEFCFKYIKKYLLVLNKIYYIFLLRVILSYFFLVYSNYFIVCIFSECQLDVVYLGWVVSLLLPALLTVFILPFVILFLLYLSALVLYIYTYRYGEMVVFYITLFCK